MNIDMHKSLILAGISGSRGYGMDHSESDTDIVGICIPPAIYTYGFSYNFEQSKTTHPLITECLDESDMNSDNELDITIYGIKKFFFLASQGNPNILEIAWMPDENVRFENKFGAIIRQHREEFLSTKVRHTFSGYAFAQLKRINTHRRWLLNPITEKPNRADFGLAESEDPKIKQVESMIRSQLSKWQLNDLDLTKDTRIALENKLSEMLAYNLTWIDASETFSDMTSDDNDQARLRAMNKIGLSDNLMQIVQSEHEFSRNLKDWQSYQDWLKNRNPARAALEEKSGYDTKHASHLIRLMRMAQEILSGEGVIVKRPDAKELLEIRNGKWSFDHLMDEVARYEGVIDSLYQNNPKIPKNVNIERLNIICADIVTKFIEANK